MVIIKMSNDYNMEIAKQLGSIDARLKNIEETNNKQWEEYKTLDGRIRSVEVKNAGISATVSGFVAVGIMAIKHSFTTQGN